MPQGGEGSVNMLLHAFNDAPDKPVILLLHGGGLSWWSVQGVASYLTDDFRVIAPIIDGHGENADETFETIEVCANKLIRLIDERFDGKVYALCGLSLGAQIAVEVLSQRPDIAQHAVIESALVVRMPLVGALAAPTYHMMYGLIKKRWFSNFQARALKLPEELFEPYWLDTARMKKQSLINLGRSNADYPLKPQISAVTAKTLVLAGEKEPEFMRKSAQLLHVAIPKSKLMIMKDVGHGELSLCYPSRYVELLREVFFEAPTDL